MGVWNDDVTSIAAGRHARRVESLLAVPRFHDVLRVCVAPWWKPIVRGKSLGDACASPVRCGLLASYFLLDFFAVFFAPFLAAFLVAIVSILPSICDG